MKIFKAKKIILSVDLLSSISQLEINLLSCLKHFITPETKIFPTYVTSISSQDDHLAVASEIRKRQLLSKSDGLFVQDPVILTQGMPDWIWVSGKAKTLLDYAREEEFDLIAVSTDIVEPAMYSLFGSFVEFLCFHSDIPLFLVTPLTKKVDGIKKVLIPTSFNWLELELYKKLMMEGVFADKEVLFYHHIQDTEGFLERISDTIFERHTKRLQEAKTELLERFQSVKNEGAKHCKSIDLKLHISSTPAANAISTFISQFSPDVVVLDESSSRWAEIFHSARTRFIISHSTAPVISIRRKAPQLDATSPQTSRPDWLQGFPETTEDEVQYVGPSKEPS